MSESWISLTFKMIQLGLAAQNVAAQRLMRLAAGGTQGQAEATRMINEKFFALAEAQMIGTMGAVTGRSADVVAGEIVQTYHKRVRANRRRLSRR